MSSSWPLLGAALLAASLALPSAAQAVTPAEAARLAFPGCELAREQVALTPRQLAQVKADAKVHVAPQLVERFVARREGVSQGVAYVDVRRVRTHTQTLLIVLDAGGKVARVEILAWKEPRRYRPKPAFWAQFRGKKLDDTLRLRRGVRSVTGATLSARAAVDAVRTVLAVHAQLSAKRPAGSPVGPADEQ